MYKSELACSERSSSTFSSVSANCDNARDRPVCSSHVLRIAADLATAPVKPDNSRRWVTSAFKAAWSFCKLLSKFSISQILSWNHYKTMKKNKNQKFVPNWDDLIALHTGSFSSILYVILLTVSPNRLNNLITPAPLNVAVLTALGSSSLLCRKFMKSGSEQRIGCCDVRRKNRSNAARRFSIHSELAPFPGSVGVCALILTFVEPKVIENLLFFKHLRDSVWRS